MVSVSQAMSQQKPVNSVDKLQFMLGENPYLVSLMSTSGDCLVFFVTLL